MADVFISYHEESAGKIVRQIAATLGKFGISCWYAGRDLRDSFFTNIITGEIDACKIFLLILDESSNQSGRVKSEVNYAWSRMLEDEKMYLIPFKVDNCILSNVMAYYLGGYAIMLGNPPDAEHIQNLVNRIADILYKQPTWEMTYTRDQRIKELNRKISELEAQIEKLQKKQPTNEKTKFSPDVFISYHVSEGSTPFVRNLANTLENVGIFCWYAPRDTKVGTFVDSILDALEKCKIFLLLLDEGANAPGYVYNETVEAYHFYKQEKHPIIIPFQVGKFQLFRGLNFYLRPFHIIDGGNSFETAVTEELIAKVSEALDALK